MTAQLELAPVDELRRVRSRLAPCIQRFWALRVMARPVFRASELHEYVQTCVPGVAPASADRVLRDLRTDGCLNYTLEKRSGSLYRALPLEPPVERPRQVPQSFWDTLVRVAADPVERARALKVLGGES